MKRSSAFESSALLKQTLRSDVPRIDRAQGVYLYDEAGREYLDGSSGAMTVAIGHGVPEVLEALVEQARRVCFTFRTQFTSTAAEELAATLAELAPGDIRYACFANSGSEATELAIRASIQYWREIGKPTKTRVLGRTTSYHGMTMGALSMSGHPPRRRDYGDTLHAWAVGPTLQAQPAPADALEQPARWREAIDAIGREHVAAVIVEPIVGAAGGALTPPPGHLRALREICDECEVLLIADEVITGMGRTGAWFGCEHDGIVPDLIAMGKGMTSGYTPMAALLLREKIARAMLEGSGIAPFGHTFSGNPLSAATCLSVIRYMRSSDVLANVRQRAPQLERGLRALAQRSSTLANVRGRGLLWGFDIHPGGTPPTPADAAAVTQRFIAACFQERLILYPAGTPPRSAALVSPPLTITEAEIATLLQRLEAAVRRFNGA